MLAGYCGPGEDKTFMGTYGAGVFCGRGIAVRVLHNSDATVNLYVSSKEHCRTYGFCHSHTPQL